LFEKICLEGFQAGLSWLTILNKRSNFRAGFADFEIAEVATFGETDVARLLADAGIVRHQGKIRSTINNAQRALELIEDEGALARYFWAWAEPTDDPPVDIPATTNTSSAISKDLKNRGWTFVGPTTVYAFMQAMGLVNDHLDGCYVREGCTEERRLLVSRGL
jgi:DNA-3-methyladenine glycosylase I